MYGNVFVMRTFKLIIEGKVKGKSKMVSLPCNGESPYTGCDALEVMRMYQKRRPKVRVNAITQNSQMENGWEAICPTLDLPSLINS